MSPARNHRLHLALLTLVLGLFPALLGATPPPLSPGTLAVSRDGLQLFVGCQTANRVLCVDRSSGGIVRSLPVPASPSGLCVSPDGKRLYVTCAAPSSKVVVFDLVTGKSTLEVSLGHTALAPVLAPDESTLYVCEEFQDCVAIVDLKTKKVRDRVAVRREPVAAALTKDGRFLLVANQLPHGRADGDYVGAFVSVIDTSARKVVKELRLLNGSTALTDVQISPDGRYACVTHILARYYLPTTQLDRGWMNTNAATLIDLDTMEIFNTFLLDGVDSGAANPRAIAWTRDGRFLTVAHAGTHEVSVIDFPALLAKITALPKVRPSQQSYSSASASQSQADVPNDLAFLAGISRRVRLPGTDRGPRAIATFGFEAFTANYFSDSLSHLSLTNALSAPKTFVLAKNGPPTPQRLGEFYFHDAGICFQGWQSCASCHPGEARIDGLNWDLLNDGIGNPKNTKSMLLTHRTPPAMSTGVRDTGETAVRAGIRHILFSAPGPEVASSMDAYLKSLQPVPSPHLVKGKLSPQARRGERLFYSSKVGCAVCHPKGLFTDLQSYDVGTQGPLDREVHVFDTPTLIEGWRTAPYLHDGSAATLRELLTTRNPKDQHGKTSHLKASELDDLEAFLLSL